jgi:acyl-CoA thioesterase-2
MASTAAFSELLGLLDLEAIDRDIFRGYHPAGREHRLYGGQIMAQCLIGAARTVDEERPPHSLHGYFLRAGDPSLPGIIHVDRMRDGGSFTTRRVVAVQHGRAIFNMDISFQKTETGLTHQMDMPEGFSPPDEDKVPDELKKETFRSWRHNYRLLTSETPQPPEQYIWFHANGDIPDEPILHTALIVYESDNALLGTARLPHRGSFKRSDMQMASLDHAMWFHHPARADQWLLYALDSPSSSSARGYNRGQIFTADGQMVASTMQEGLMRHHG